MEKPRVPEAPDAMFGPTGPDLDDFLRVFSLTSSAVTSRHAERSLNERKYESYIKAVKKYNVNLLRRQMEIESYRGELRVYRGRSLKYKSDYVVYEAQYAHYAREVESYNATQREKLPTYPKSPRALAAPEIKIPRSVQALSREQVKSQEWRGSTRFHKVELSAELVVAKSGEIVWAGKLKAVGEPSHRELLALMIENLSNSKKK